MQYTMGEAVKKFYCDNVNVTRRPGQCVLRDSGDVRHPRKSSKRKEPQGLALLYCYIVTVQVKYDQIAAFGIILYPCCVINYN